MAKKKEEEVKEEEAKVEQIVFSVGMGVRIGLPVREEKDANNVGIPITTTDPEGRPHRYIKGATKPGRFMFGKIAGFTSSGTPIKDEESGEVIGKTENDIGIVRWNGRRDRMSVLPLEMLIPAPKQ